MADTTSRNSFSCERGQVDRILHFINNKFQVNKIHADEYHESLCELGCIVVVLVMGIPLV